MDPSIVSIAARDDALVVRVSATDAPVNLVELAPFQLAEVAKEAQPLWRGRPAAGDIQIPRFDGERDRLYSKFTLTGPEGEPLCAPRYVTDLSALPVREDEIPWPDSIKGVTCPVDIPDLLELGVKHVDFGVLLAGVVNWTDEDPEEYWVVDGHKVGINRDYVESLDRQIEPMTDAGINVILIPVNSVPTEPDPACPLIHPMTNLAETPNHLGAFNVTDERGIRYLRGAFEYMADRWSDPSGEHGRVSGYVVGNELQSHWYWHNQGDATLEQVVDDYAIALRVAWLAVRRTHRGLRVYASLDHSWLHPADPNPLRAARGDHFLERMNRQIKAGGDFPWHLGFHPYPENLFEPRFWRDKMAVMGFDTPKITFKNLEVLPAYLGQRRFLFQGERRRIILSEQGFHAPEGPEGERVQAAAYAYAYHKTRHIPEVDAFILHRHVDHRAEFGLRLGLWAADPEGEHPSSLGEKRLIWHVFRLADTEKWREAFAFALPIIGLDSWDEALPYRGPIPLRSGLIAEPVDRRLVVYDLIEHMSEPTGDKGLGWRTEWHRGPDRLLYPTLFQHPRNPNESLAEAVYTVGLPEGDPLVLEFGTSVVHDDGNGVRFRVLVDGDERFTVDRAAGTSELHSLSLAGLAGKTVELTLSTDPLGDASYDWAHWLRPVIVRWR